MRVSFEIEINNDEFVSDTWQNEVRHIARHYFKTGVGVSLLVDGIPGEADNISAVYDIETDEFDPQ